MIFLLSFHNWTKKVLKSFHEEDFTSTTNNSLCVMIAAVLSASCKFMEKLHLTSNGKLSICIFVIIQYFILRTCFMYDWKEIVLFVNLQIAFFSHLIV